MVECAFGTVCNKWRIFHCAIDVCPDFYDETVKTVAHYTASCVRETAFSFRILSANVPSRVFKLLAIEVMLQERIRGGGLKGRECLFLGELAGG
jgi:hypothetical protein